MDLATTQVSIETITPERARFYLSLNANNRPISSRMVEQYAEDLRAGRWQFNGDTIRVSEDRLLDGQHRLHAIIAAGIPLQSIVVSGLDNDVFNTIDSGRKRTGSDVLSVAGETNTARLAAALRQIWLYKNRQINRQDENFSNSLVLRELKHHATIRDSVRQISRFKTSRILSGAVASAYHYLFSYVNSDAATDFFKGLYTGEMLHSTSAVYHLHHRFVDAMSQMATRSSSQRILRQEVRVALLIKAFNNFIEDRPTRTLRWSINESFPEITGLAPEAVDEAAATKARLNLWATSVI